MHPGQAGRKSGSIACPDLRLSASVESLSGGKPAALSIACPTEKTPPENWVKVGKARKGELRPRSGSAGVERLAQGVGEGNRDTRPGDLFFSPHNSFLPVFRIATWWTLGRWTRIPLQLDWIIAGRLNVRSRHSPIRTAMERLIKFGNRCGRHAGNENGVPDEL